MLLNGSDPSPSLTPGLTPPPQSDLLHPRPSLKLGHARLPPNPPPRKPVAPKFPFEVFSTRHLSFARKLVPTITPGSTKSRSSLGVFAVSPFPPAGKVSGHVLSAGKSSLKLRHPGAIVHQLNPPSMFPMVLRNIDANYCSRRQLSNLAMLAKYATSTIAPATGMRNSCAIRPAFSLREIHGIESRRKSVQKPSNLSLAAGKVFSLSGPQEVMMRTATFKFAFPLPCQHPARNLATLKQEGAKKHNAAVSFRPERTEVEELSFRQY